MNLSDIWGAKGEPEVVQLEGEAEALHYINRAKTLATYLQENNGFTVDHSISKIYTRMEKKVDESVVSKMVRQSSSALVREYKHEVFVLAGRQIEKIHMLVDIKKYIRYADRHFKNTTGNLSQSAFNEQIIRSLNMSSVFLDRVMQFDWHYIGHAEATQVHQFLPPKAKTIEL